MYEGGGIKVLDSIVIETEKPIENGHGGTKTSREAYVSSGQHNLFGSIFINTDANQAIIFDAWETVKTSLPHTDERDVAKRWVVEFPLGGSIELKKGNETVVFTRKEIPWSPLWHTAFIDPGEPNLSHPPDEPPPAPISPLQMKFNL